MPRRKDLESILIIGSGPIVIGQACEFDYSGTQACKALREEGIRVILINSNPATIMTDPEIADRTYIEPITPECVEKIIVREVEEMKRMGANGKLVLLPTLGGQTALNLAMELTRKGVLERYGVEMIGAKPEVIEKAESRQRFREAMERIGLESPRGQVVVSVDEALAALDDVEAGGELGHVMDVGLREQDRVATLGDLGVKAGNEFLNLVLHFAHSFPHI